MKAEVNILSQDIWVNIDNYTRNEVKRHVMEQFNSKVRVQVCKMRIQVRDQVDNRIQDQIWNHIWDQINFQVKND